MSTLTNKQNFKAYIVRFAEKKFFQSRTEDGTAVLGTRYMSFARAMTYLTATEVACNLRELGYADAIVTDMFGEPVSLDNIKQDGSNIQEFLTVWTFTRAEEGGTNGTN